MNKSEQIINNIENVIIGKTDKIKMILTCLIAKGHILIEDAPGTGKTMLCKALAKSVNFDFKRIQFTPDLLPSDITGINIYNKKTEAFDFLPGPVFSNLLLADEINRATPRTQSGLLECMEEKQATIDGKTLKMKEPFFVIATQNPIETYGTFPLPEAQLDRFLMKISLGFLSKDEEINVLTKYLSNTPINEINEVCTIEDLITMQKEAEKVFVHKDVLSYIAEIVEKTRNTDGVLNGVSTRGAIGLLNASKAYAYIKGGDFVTPDDIKQIAVFVLAHRLTIKSGYPSGEDIIKSILNTVPVPTENFNN